MATKKKATVKVKYEYSRAQLEEKLGNIIDTLNNMDVMEATPNDMENSLNGLESDLEDLRADLVAGKA